MTVKSVLFFLAIELALAGASCTSKCIDAAPPNPAAVAQDTAQYEPVVPSVQFEHGELEGFSVISHVPDDPTGLIFFFHGSHGSSAFAEKVESVAVLNAFIAVGFGFASTDSTQRVEPKRWDRDDLDPESNDDLARLWRLRDDFIEDGAITPQTPIFAVGMSNGGSFASVFGHAAAEAGWPIRAIAIYNAPVPSVVRDAGGPGVPAFFVISGNDTVVSNDTIEVCYEEIVDAGVPAELHEVSERALSPFRFSRISGISSDMSRVACDLLVEEGVIGSTGVRLMATCEAAERIKGLDLDPLFNAHRADMEDQLAAVWAVHQFNSEFAAQNVIFFLAHL